MSEKIIYIKWNHNIPIEVVKNQKEIFNPLQWKNVSLDGLQYSEITDKINQTLISIFQIETNSLIREISIPNSTNDYYRRKIFFTSEYLLFTKITHEYHGPLYIYLHNCILNKGKYFDFDEAKLTTHFYQDSIFYLLLLQQSKKLQLYRIDQQFKIQKVNEIDNYNLRYMKQNNLGFYAHKDNKILFLNKSTLKTSCQFIYYDKWRPYYQQHFDIDFHNNLFFTNLLDGICILVGQIRNSKRIRKIPYNHQEFYLIISRCLYKNYIFTISDYNYLIVHNLQTGEQIGSLKFEGFNSIQNISVQNGTLVLQTQKGPNIRWKLNN